MKFLLLGGLLVGCTQLASVLQGASCPEPDPTYEDEPLITCQLPRGSPDITCCAYGYFKDGRSSGDLCFHVLCKTNACGEYEWTEDVCVPSETHEEGTKASFDGWDDWPTPT
jgi:hypothetical protein